MLEKRAEVKALLALAFPIILGQVGQMLMQAIDTAMVGRLPGPEPVAACSLGTHLVHLILLFGFGLGLAVQILVARAHGAGDMREVSHVLRHGLVIAAVYSITCAVVLTFNTDILRLLGQEPEVVERARPYVVWVVWSLVPTLFYHCFKTTSESCHKPWLPFLCMGAGLLANVLFNSMFIFGNFGAPAMGLEGAGVATLLARSVMLLFMLVGFLKVVKLPALPSASDYFRFEWWRFRKMLAIGVPGGGQIMFEAGAFTMAVFMMGWIGPTAQAANQVVLSYAALVFMVPLGLSFAMSIRVGRAMGAGDATGARRTGFIGLACALLFMASFSIVTFLMREEIPLIFVADKPEVALLASKMLFVVALFAVFDGVQIAAIGALRGLSDVVLPAVLLACAFWLIGLPFGAYLAFAKEFGAIGIWWGLLTGLGLTAIGATWRFHWLTRAQNS